MLSGLLEEGRDHLAAVLVFELWVPKEGEELPCG
jgi:hypothetical protein